MKTINNFLNISYKIVKKILLFCGKNVMNQEKKIIAPCFNIINYLPSDLYFFIHRIITINFLLASCIYCNILKCNLTVITNVYIQSNEYHFTLLFIRWAWLYLIIIEKEFDRSNGIQFQANHCNSDTPWCVIRQEKIRWWNLFL